MTKIRYRAFDKHMKTMGEVTSIRFFDHQYDHVSARFTIRGKKIDENYNVGYDGSDNIILMQYTGLKDTNGVEIYEGDIVREHVNDYTPIYQNGIYMAYNVDKINDPYVSTQFNVIWRNGCEIIGNIHDNPELVKEEAE